MVAKFLVNLVSFFSCEANNIRLSTIFNYFICAIEIFLSFIHLTDLFAIKKLLSNISIKVIR